MEITTHEIEILLSAHLDGRADGLTKQVVAAWLCDTQNLQEFYEFLFRAESNDPIFNTDVEVALALLKSRSLKTNE